MIDAPARALPGPSKPKLPPYTTEGRWSNEDIEKTVRRAWLAVMLFALGGVLVAGICEALGQKPYEPPPPPRILQPGPDGSCPPDAICPHPVPSKS